MEDTLPSPIAHLTNHNKLDIIEKSAWKILKTTGPYSQHLKENYTLLSKY